VSDRPEFEKFGEDIKVWTQNAGKKIGEWTSKAGKKTEEAAGSVSEWAGDARIEIDPENMDDSLRLLGEKIRGLYDQGRYTKVRLKYKGKQIGPDIPMGLVLAGELATAIWAGPLRVVVVNLGIKAIIDIELVHEASNKVREGLDYYGDGEVELAEQKYREALKMKPGDTGALYNLGVVLRVTGRKDEAKESFLSAAEDEEHPDGKRAREALGRMERRDRDRDAD
jgi:tetratricopeptide (TPR) repeat protein